MLPAGPSNLLHTNLVTHSVPHQPVLSLSPREPPGSGRSNCYTRGKEKV